MNIEEISIDKLELPMNMNVQSNGTQCEDNDFLDVTEDHEE